MTEYATEARAKGWTLKAIAERWGLSQRRLSQIAANPTQRNWDALNGLPDLKAALCSNESSKNIRRIKEGDLRLTPINRRGTLCSSNGAMVGRRTDFTC